MTTTAVNVKMAIDFFAALFRIRFICTARIYQVYVVLWNFALFPKQSVIVGWMARLVGGFFDLISAAL